MVTKHENEEDYEYMFSALKRIVKELHQIDFEPTILLADTAGAITNGFSNVFKLTHRVFCWSHVKRNIDAIQIRPRLPINEFLAQIENDEYSF